MKLKEYSRTVIGIVIAALLFILWRWDNSKGRNDHRVIGLHELTAIHGTAVHRPVVDHDPTTVYIKLKEFPDFDFMINPIRFKAMNASAFIDELAASDTITLYILHYDYVTKIKKEKALRFSEELINYHTIEPISIKVKGTTYMTLADANKAWQEEYDLGWWFLFWVLGLAVIIGMILLVLRRMGFARKFKAWQETESRP